MATFENERESWNGATKKMRSAGKFALRLFSSLLRIPTHVLATTVQTRNAPANLTLSCYATAGSMATLLSRAAREGHPVAPALTPDQTAGSRHLHKMPQPPETQSQGTSPIQTSWVGELIWGSGEERAGEGTPWAPGTCGVSAAATITAATSARLCQPRRSSQCTER